MWERTQVYDDFEGKLSNSSNRHLLSPNRGKSYQLGQTEFRFYKYRFTGPGGFREKLGYFFHALTSAMPSLSYILIYIGASIIIN